MKFWPKSDFFSGFFGVKIFKNKTLIKKSAKTFPRYTYLDGFGKFLVIFVQKYFFTLVKKCLGQKITFLAISQKYDF